MDAVLFFLVVTSIFFMAFCIASVIVRFFWREK